MGRKNRPTLSDVAHRAGVSTATASLALAGKAAQVRISSDTLRRVQQAAEELDYTPNLLVRSLQRGRTQILSFFNAFRSRRTPSDLYMGRLLPAIEQSAGRLGYNLLTFCDFKSSPEEMYRTIAGGHADGVLVFAPTLEDPLLPLLRQSRLPAVLLNTRDPEGYLASVEDDMASGMRQVAHELLRLGHREIAILVEPTGGQRDLHRRVSLFQTYLSEYGVAIPEARVVPYSSSAFADLMRGGSPPTAIFCWRDRLAYYVLEDCERLGISVPEQLSLVGYDGITWPASTRHTAASVHVDLEILSERAVALLDHLIQSEVPSQLPLQEYIPVTLKPGTTLGKAATEAAGRGDSVR